MFDDLAMFGLLQSVYGMSIFFYLFFCFAIFFYFCYLLNVSFPQNIYRIISFNKVG